MRLLLLALAALFAALPVSAQYEASLVADINPSGDSFPGLFIEYDNRLFFRADDGNTGAELWAHDTITDQTGIIADINTVANHWWWHFEVYDDRLFFRADNGNGESLWYYDAATSQISLAVDISPSGQWYSPSDLTTYDGRLFFVADDVDALRLWAYEAETGQAVVIDDHAPYDYITTPHNIIVFNDLLFFITYTEPDSSELWNYNSTTDEFSFVADVGTPNNFVVYNNDLYFRDHDTISGYELWRYDPITGATNLVADINPNGDSHPSDFEVYDDLLFFQADDGEHGIELWVYDAAIDEASLVVDIAPGSYQGVINSSTPSYLTVYDGLLFFRAFTLENGAELWAYDAENDEAFLVADIAPGPAPLSSRPTDLTVHAGRLFFSAANLEYGNELWMLTPTDVANEPSVSTAPARLHAPHPNPAQEHATVSFEVAEAGPVRVEVLDVLGRRVAVLKDETLVAGEHTARWDAGALPSGLYLVRLTAGDQVQTRRLTLTR